MSIYISIYHIVSVRNRYETKYENSKIVSNTKNIQIQYTTILGEGGGGAGSHNFRTSSSSNLIHSHHHLQLKTQQTLFYISSILLQISFKVCCILRSTRVCVQVLSVLYQASLVTSLLRNNREMNFRLID